MKEDEIILMESLKTKIKEFFKLDLDPEIIIVSEMDLSRSAKITIFSYKKHLFGFVDSQPKLSIADARKLFSKANIVQRLFLPPQSDKNFFIREASEKFKKVYPGMNPTSEKDLIFYKTLIKYNPILIEIEQIQDETINCFDSNSPTDWRPFKKILYKRK